MTQNFGLKSQVPNFERDQFKTLAAMKAYPETALDDGHLSYCVETGKTYQYKSANAADAATGKWRVFLPDAVDLSGYATTSAMNTALAGKADKAALDAKQEKLASGTNIKTVNGESLLGAGNISIDLTLYKVVDELPATGIDPNKIYLVLSAVKGTDNTYTEYVYVDSKWEKLGEYTASVDLTPYAKKADVAADIKAAVDPAADAAAAAMTAAGYADKGATLLFSGIVEGEITDAGTGTAESGEVVFSAFLKRFVLRIAQPGQVGAEPTYKYYAAWTGNAVYNSSDTSRTHVYQYGKELYVRDADGLTLVTPDMSAYYRKEDTDAKIANAKAKTLSAAANADTTTVKLTLADGTAITADLPAAMEGKAGVMTAAQVQHLAAAEANIDGIAQTASDNATAIAALQQAVKDLQAQIAGAGVFFE